MSGLKSLQEYLKGQRFLPFHQPHFTDLMWFCQDLDKLDFLCGKSRIQTKKKQKKNKKNSQPGLPTLSSVSGSGGERLFMFLLLLTPSEHLQDQPRQAGEALRCLAWTQSDQPRTSRPPPTLFLFSCLSQRWRHVGFGDEAVRWDDLTAQCTPTRKRHKGGAEPDRRRGADRSQLILRHQRTSLG